jgi:hypothetical protein
MAADTRDKRLFRRVPEQFMALYTVKAPFQTYVNLKGRDCDGTAYDLSEGGVAMATNYDIPIGAVIVLKFTLFGPNGPYRLQIESEVRYAEHVDADNSFRLGVRFLQIPAADRAFLVDYIKRQAA